MRRVFAAAVLFLACNAAAETVTLFSGGDLSAWEYRSFSGIPETEYRAAADAELGSAALFANSGKGASGYIREMPLNPQKTPWLHFQWRIDEAGEGFDERAKNGDDFAFRIYFAVRDGLKYKSLSLVRSQGRRGDSWQSPFAAWFNDLRIYAAIGGKDARGAWQTTSLNLAVLWKKLFGETPQTFGLVGIMTDGDSSGVLMRARYGAIVLSDSPTPPFNAAEN